MERKKDLFDLVSDIEMTALTTGAIAESLMTHYEDFNEDPSIDPKNTCFLLHQISLNMREIGELVKNVMAANRERNQAVTV